MIKQRYTAQEMREEADFHAFRHGDGYKVVEMLRHAADAEAELARLDEQNEKLDAWATKLLSEVEQARAQLDAFVKECERVRTEKLDSWTDDINYKVHSVREEYDMIDSILRAARGEGGAE